MNRLWQKEYFLRASDFDKFGHIKPSSVLDLFQDAAGQHAEELGVGFEEMLKRSYLWVLTRVKFKILGETQKYQKVIVKTWPLEPSRITYRREYSIENENGELLIGGSSEWVVIHSENAVLSRQVTFILSLTASTPKLCAKRNWAKSPILKPLPNLML